MVSDAEADRVVRLTPLQQRMLYDMITQYLEGVEVAKELTVEDRSLQDMDVLLEICGSYDTAVTELTKVQQQLVGVMPE
jgi:hypothetical protein